MLTEALRRAFGETPFRPREAADVLGIRSPYSTLNRLKSAGILERVGRATYRFAPLDGWERLDAYLEQETLRSTRTGRAKTIGELAAKRFLDWRSTGYLVRTGQRRYEVRLRTGPVKGLDVRRA